MEKNNIPQLQDLQNKEKYYSEDGLLEKFKNCALKAGINVIYNALLLFHLIGDSKTPVIYKGIIIGALGYFISPIDLVPDFIPLLGYSDDLAALTLALSTVLSGIGHLDPKIKAQTREDLTEWFRMNEENRRKLDEIEEEF